MVGDVRDASVDVINIIIASTLQSVSAIHDLFDWGYNISLKQLFGVRHK